MVDRIKRRAIRENRSDDANEGVIKTRFEVHRRESEPVINCYPKSIVAPVEANLSPMEVLLQILGILIPVQKEWQSRLK
jgi:adenylate kinase